jgi:hypothetical protein
MPGAKAIPTANVKPTKPSGLTAQYVTIAIALRIALFEYFDRSTLIAKRYSVDGNEELEARRLTIVLLVAALCESCINTALALSSEPNEFKTLERKPTLSKWFDEAKRVNPKFQLDRLSAVGFELAFVFDCRNSITHANAEVYSETSTIHSGNHTPWAAMSHDRVLSVAKLPIALLNDLCSGTAPLIASMSSGVAWQLSLHEFEERSSVQRAPEINP